MKIRWNGKYNTIAIYSIIVIAVAVLFIVFVFRYDSITNGLSWVGAVFAPILWGFGIAYILNPLMMLFENRLFVKLKNASDEPAKTKKKNAGKKGKASIKQRVADIKVVQRIEEVKQPAKGKKRRTAARVLSIVLTYIVVIAVLTGVVLAVLPNISNSLVDLADQLPGYVDNFDKWLGEILDSNPMLASYISEEIRGLNDILQKIANAVEPMMGNISSGILSFAKSVVTFLKDFIIGLIIAIYLLFCKERLQAQSKKVICAFFKPRRAEKILSTCAKSNRIFTKYIISNLVDALLVFAVMAIGMVILDMPYAILIAVICGITNLIPFFGPFIGAIPCGILILLVDPIKVIWFGIFVLVLQQLDGNVIKPLLFGETMGLPAIWVLISIIIFGGIFGIPGMLLGSPVFAVIYLLFGETVSQRLKKRNMPTDTDSYTEGEKLIGLLEQAVQQEEAADSPDEI